jgi:signal transduction histidine kinase
MSRPGATPDTPGRAPRRALHLAVGAATLQARSIFRVLAAVAVGGMLLSRADENTTMWATLVPLLGGLYVLVTTITSWRRDRAGWFTDHDRRSDVVRALADVLVICVVAGAVNEPRVAVLLILCAIPLGYGLTLPASAVAVVTAVAVTGCLAVWATGPLLNTGGISEGSLLLVAFALSWCGLVACLIAVERERRAQRITKLSESVRDMLQQALRAEANERSRVADLLHDDVLQLLLATRHDISDAIDGDLELLPEARAGIEAATRRLRATIVALRDEGTGDLPVGESLRALADDAGGARGVEVSVDVDPALDGLRNPVLVSAARDLIRDAESSSAAPNVCIRASRSGAAILLVVSHDDRRFALGLDVTADAAELLHDVEARVNALDGTLDVEHNDAGARTVTIRVPVASGGRTAEDLPAPVDDATYHPPPKVV